MCAGAQTRVAQNCTSGTPDACARAGGTWEHEQTNSPRSQELWTRAKGSRQALRQGRWALQPVQTADEDYD